MYLPPVIFDGLKDAFLILNLDKNASETEIKQAYRKLAQKYHPDKNANDELSVQLFHEIKSAYDFLMDPVNRKKAGQQFQSFRKAPEPSALLAEAEQLLRWVKQADPYRLNQDSLLYRLQQLLRSSHIYILKNNADENMQTAFVSTIIQAIEPLNPKYYQQVLQWLEPIGVHQQSFYLSLLKKKKQKTMARTYTIFLALIIAVLLCLLIVFVSPG